MNHQNKVRLTCMTSVVISTCSTRIWKIGRRSPNLRTSECIGVHVSNQSHHNTWLVWVRKLKVYVYYYFYCIYFSIQRLFNLKLIFSFPAIIFITGRSCNARTPKIKASNLHKFKASQVYKVSSAKASDLC